MIAKVAGGVLGLGLIGTGGVAFVKPEWLGINKEIEWKPLVSDDDFSNESNGYSGKFGETYKNYLTGVKGNQNWWKESFERLKEDSSSATKPSDQFKFGEGSGKVNKAFVNPDSKDDTALNQICKKVYKETTTNIKPSPATDNTSEYKEADVWKYCSGLGQKPTTVKDHDNKDTTNAIYKEESGGTKPIGKEEEDSLISVNDEKNNKFWEIRDKEFHGKDPFTPKPSFDENNDKFFKQGQADEKKIKDLCKEAYTKNSASSSSETAPTKSETKKYCSLTLAKN